MIRQAEIKDCKRIGENIKEVMIDAWEKYEKEYYPREALEFDLKLFSSENIEKALEQRERYVFIYEKDEIQGVAIGIIFGMSGYSLLSWIGVLPRFQRKGIGSSLLDTVVRYCRKKGCHKISLNTLPVLRPALNFYLKHGFVPEAFLRKQWWKVDFIFMSKWLD